MIIDSIRIEWQGHCPNDLYEDGFMDALAEIEKTVKDNEILPMPYETK